MFDFIPLENYTTLYYNFMLIVVVAVFLQSFNGTLHIKKNIQNKRLGGLFVMWLVILYMGLRPISGMYFGDMERYAGQFISYAEGESLSLNGDLFFQYFTKFCSSFMSVHFYFLLCAFLYIYPLYLVSIKLFKNYWFYAFLMLIASFTFWGGGVNGIRNGLAASFFLLAITRDSKKNVFLWILLSVLFHKSLLLPAVAYLLTMYYGSSKSYIYFWFLAIPLSLAIGGFFENLFLGLGFGVEDRLGSYLTELDEAIQNSKSGFRWDFLVYSATGVFAGYYFIIKKGFNDLFYARLFNIYLICNAFWILIIRANFSNRFAYLSWFMLPLVIIYPFLKQKLIAKQHQWIGRIILLYFTFTYILNVILTT